MGRAAAALAADDDPERGRGRRDPTQAEIAARAAEIRRGWSPAERARRSRQPAPLPWLPPLAVDPDDRPPRDAGD